MWAPFVLLLLCFVWQGLYYFPYIVDDTFISLRYARNLVDGHGLVYNPAQRVEGYSNFLWVVLEAGMMWLGWPVITGIKVVGLVSGAAAAMLTFFLAAHIYGARPGRMVASFVAFALVCLNSSVAVWAPAGLETGLFALLLIAACLRYEVELDRGRGFPWSGILYALAWMTRPEAPVYGLYFLVRGLLSWRDRSRRGALCRSVLAFCALVIPYEVWGLWYYGELLPHTHVAKIGEAGFRGFAAFLRRSAHQPLLVTFVTAQGWGLIVLLALGIAGCIRRIRTLPLVAWLPVVCGVVFVLYAQADWMPRFRLFVPLIPFLCVTLGYGIGVLYQWARRSQIWVLIWCVAFGAPVVDYARHQLFAPYPYRVPTFAARGREWGWWRHVPGLIGERYYPKEHLAWSFLCRIPVGETICARDIGFVGYLTMNPMWDTAGLFTPTVARARYDSSEDARRAVCDELLELQPACIFLEWGPWGGPWREAAPFNKRLDTWLWTNAAVAAQYVRLPKTDATSATVTYVRRGLPRLDVQERVRAAVRGFPEYEERANELLARYSREVGRSRM